MIVYNSLLHIFSYIFFFSRASLKFNTFRIEPIDKQCPHEVDISGEALLT